MVEWKELHKIVTSVCTGLNPRNNFVLNEDGAKYYYVTVKEIITGKIVFSKSTDKIAPNAKSIINKRSNLEQGDILFSGIGTIGKVAYVDIPTNNWDCSESIFLIKPNEKLIQRKYLFYILTSDIVKRQYEKGASGAIMKGVRKATLMNILIPIPNPIEQQRIVGILDTFTSSIDNLKQQIDQRRKQYDCYREKLLDLEGKPGVEMKTIAEVAKCFTGLTYKPENISDSGTLVLRSSNIDENKLVFEDNVYVQMDIPERTVVHENDLLICVRNGSKRLIGKAAMITKEAEGMAFGAFMTILRCFDINSKYLYYTWQSEKTKKQYKGDEAMPIAQIIAKDFQRIVIPVPSIQKQQRIVSTLDTFEASIQNLEAQLEQRQKQYEYYRNKLLTFE